MSGSVPEKLASPVFYSPGAEEHPHVDRDEVLRYLGYAGQEIGDELSEWIEGIVAGVERDFAPQGVRRVFPVDASSLDASGQPCIRLEGSEVVLSGRDVYRHLKDADWCALMAVTLGSACERRLRVLSSQRPSEAVVFDAACSAYAEAAIGCMDADVREAAGGLSLSANWRFSCGYGDCPLDAQPSIVASLDATRRIGLTVLPSNLLLPSKSVTAMVGLFRGRPGSADARPTCGVCRMRGSCAFRKRGVTCYGETVSTD